MKNFAVLSSSRGTTFEATMEAQRRGDLTMPCLGLITNKPKSECIERARRMDVPVRILPNRHEEDRDEYDERLFEALNSIGASTRHTVIALMGWMRILGPTFVKRWKAINVHPSLLPRHKGLMGDAVHEAVLRNKELVTGMTIHRVTEKVDEGPIVLKAQCCVEDDDTVTSLRERVQALERDCYWQVLQEIYEGTLSLPSSP